MAPRKERMTAPYEIWLESKWQVQLEFGNVVWYGLTSAQRDAAAPVRYQDPYCFQLSNSPGVNWFPEDWSGLICIPVLLEIREASRAK